MSFLSRALGIRAGIEDPNVPLGWSALLDVMGAAESEAGVLVTPRTSLQQSAVHACVRVIAETLGSLPLKIYQRVGNSEVQATGHRLWPLLHDQPNPQMTAITFRETVTAQILLWGNGYAEIRRDRSGRVTALWPLPSDRTRPVRLGSKLVYETTVRPELDPYVFQVDVEAHNGEPRFIDVEDMIHVPGLSFNGILGISPIELARRTVGLSIAADKFGALFFGSGSRPSGILSHPKALREETRKNIERSWRQATSRENAHKAIVLEEGITWQPMSIPPDEAQFLETRQFQVAEIARIYRVPLHLIQELSRSTNNNIEQQSREFVMHTMRPWAVRWEQEIFRKLLSAPFSARHDFSDLLRGDFQTRMQGYQILRNAGVLSTNDIRLKEGWNPVPEEEGGDALIVPLNMTSLEKLASGEDEAEPAQPPPEPGDDDTDDGDASQDEEGGDVMRRRMVGAYSRLFRDCVSRALKREKRSPAAMTAIFAPAITAMAEGLVAMEFAHERGLNEAATVLIRELAASAAARCEGWSRDSLDSISAHEAQRAYDALRTNLHTLTEAVQ